MVEKALLNILIVDDDEDDYLIMGELFSELKGQKYHLDLATDYAEALAVIKDNRHDVYLFDYRLGRNSGLDLLRAAIDQGCTAPIILLTGQGDQDIDLKAMKMGAADYLVKGEINALFLDRTIRYALEHKKMENTLRTMVEDLQEAQREFRRAENVAKVKSNFLANMSHEIRTPMNSILGFSELLGRTRLDAQQRGYLNIVLSSGELLIGIIDDILNISKLESGEIVLESSEFNLEDLILDTFKMIVIRMRDNPFDTYFLMAEDVPKDVFGDFLRLKQVLVNLLGNAVKFTTKGEIGVLVERESGDPPAGQVRLRFTVKDTGIGIPKDKQGSIFKSFSQVDETTTRRFGGTGLGLAIAKAIVEIMGGKIWVESEEGRGSRFIFTVVLKKAQRSAGPGAGQGVPGLLKGKKIFVVDDNEMARKIIQKYCCQMGLDLVGMADSSESALGEMGNLVKGGERIPEVILCDLIMEGMDGFELARRMKKIPELQEARYIAVTADMTAEISGKAEEGTFDAYVTKPVSLTSLLEGIKRGMNIVEADKEERRAWARCRGIKVLVVEDSLPNQMLIKTYFEELQCEGDFARNGREAIDKLKTNRYDLCLMDLHMPAMSGVEATRIVRRDISEHLPIVALTAAVLEEDQKEAREAGMNDFLTKPIDSHKLAETINRYGRQP